MALGGPPEGLGKLLVQGPFKVHDSCTCMYSSTHRATIYIHEPGYGGVVGAPGT
jgi:hypothetical protein